MVNLLSSHLKLVAEWHPTKNGDLKPEDVVASSKRKVWWKCFKGEDHGYLWTLLQ